MPPYIPVRRTLVRLVVPLALLLLGSCDRMTPSGFSGDVDVLLNGGKSYVATLMRTDADQLTDAEVIALGYVERARLGLGSPFRLIEYAMRDPDLPPEVRQQLAYGLLSRTLDGDTYVVDPRVLGPLGLATPVLGLRAGEEQLQLIQRVIASSPSARAGERTVRLGYMLAAAERTVEPEYESVIAHVAALVSDRRRSREDARRLLRTAASAHEDPLVLLQEWRRERRFLVEQPSLAEATVIAEEAEARDGPALALALRTLAQRQSAPTSFSGQGPELNTDRLASVLSPSVAMRLSELARQRNYPAQAPIAVAVEINRDGFLDRTGPARYQHRARERFVANAINEERLVAGAALFSGTGRATGQRFPLILLQAATFLRVWNQEEPWFPGDPTPSRRDLIARYGLADISFDDDVDPAWHGYYLRMLWQGLGDLQRVLPTMSIRGLSIRIGDLPSDVRALALHEPRTRTLYLPAATGAGTLAHELAHDLDWQLARRRYGMRGGYATDMAVRSHRGDRIASAMMELSTSLVPPGTELAGTPHATRPAEVFARGTDWLVAASLARDGKLGGYLSSFQDGVLTGYGTTRGPDITGGAVPALLSLLDASAPVPGDTREWVLERYGPSRSLTAMDLARAVMSAGDGLPPEERLHAIADAGALSLEAVDDCRFASSEGLRRLVAAQRSLAEASLSAAARGAAIDGVRELAASRLGGAIRPVVDRWLAWRLYGAPEPIDPSLDALIPAFEDLLLRAELAEQPRSIRPAVTTFEINPVPSMCGGNPFAADSPVGRFRQSARLASR